MAGSSSVKHREDIQDAAAQVDEARIDQIAVYGVLAVPIFSHTENFPGPTAVHVASNICLDAIKAQFHQVLGKEPGINNLSISALPFESDILILPSRAPDQESNTVILLYRLNDTNPSLFEDLATKMRKALQENLVLTDKINAVSPTQVASTAQLSRSARKKANEKKTSQAHQPAKDSPTIADVLAEVAKISQRVMRIEEEYGILKTDNETLKAGTETLKAGTETLKAGTETLKAEVRTLKAEVSTLKAEVRALKADNRTLIARVEHLENIVHPLHQRVVLDKARDKLLDECNLSRSDYPDPEALLEAAKDKLKTLTPPPLSLSDPALRMIFLGGSVRDQGNSAAHDASPEDLGVAVLRSDLPNKQRDVLTEIYTYLTGEEPVLKSIV